MNTWRLDYYRTDEDPSVDYVRLSHPVSLFFLALAIASVQVSLTLGYSICCFIDQTEKVDKKFTCIRQINDYGSVSVALLTIYNC